MQPGEASQQANKERPKEGVSSLLTAGTCGSNFFFLGGGAHCGSTGYPSDTPFMEPLDDLDCSQGRHNAYLLWSLIIIKK